jgi:hypothetical protein
LLAEVTGGAFGRSRLWAAACAVIWLFAATGSAARSIAAHESVSPFSSAGLWADVQMVNNPWPVAMPQIRLDRMRERVMAAKIPLDAYTMDAPFPELWRRQYESGIISWPAPPRNLPSILWGDSPPAAVTLPGDWSGTVRPRIGFLDP